MLPGSWLLILFESKISYSYDFRAAQDISANVCSCLIVTSVFQTPVNVQTSQFTLFDMGTWWPPKMFLTTVPKRLRRGNWNLVTFNINLWSIKKSYFWFSRLSGVTIAMSLSGSTQNFLKLSFHMFPYNEILKVSKSKNLTWYLKQASQNTSKYQISPKSVKESES